MANFDRAATVHLESTLSQTLFQLSALSWFGVILVLGFFLANLKGLLFSYHVSASPIESKDVAHKNFRFASSTHYLTIYGSIALGGSMPKDTVQMQYFSP